MATGKRVLRGGSWNNNNTDNFRCANRNNNNPENRNNNNGFRCASTLNAEAALFTDKRGASQSPDRFPVRLGKPGRI